VKGNIKKSGSTVTQGLHIKRDETVSLLSNREKGRTNLNLSGLGNHIGMVKLREKKGTIRREKLGQYGGLQISSIEKWG